MGCRKRPDDGFDLGGDGGFVALFGDVVLGVLL